ncbi:MAG: glycoside hydrolase family 28 protein [Acidobacteria bacterium]|nr:glycoside hydrolase family 28 protein [Acidobacteriota bacterium]
MTTLTQLKQLICSLAIFLALLHSAEAQTAGVYDVKAFGAKGDGQTVDSAAINKAIETAAAAGGGTVRFPAGTYLSFSLRLRSNITLYLDSGATILAAEPGDKGKYDLPEPNEWDMYQDFGHSHWQNSLIWGIGLENVSILGPGKIDGTKGLTRRGPGPRAEARPGDSPNSLGGGRPNNRPQTPLGEGAQRNPNNSMDGQGNKAIGLKLCRNVTLRDFSILMGGHFAVLATGVDNLTIDNVKMDTNRDGFDIDACRYVRISNCAVNAPNDDAIVIKSSFALGFARATEHLTITNCQVMGYDLGSFFDGTFKRTQQQAPDRDGVTGRIKLGTESNGGFKNITISNCIFDRSRGLALETVDGGLIEDITITNITMRDVTTAPIFLRLGSRMRGPKDTPIGAIRRVNISNILVSDAETKFASLIVGLPGHPIEDVKLSNIRIVYRGGGTKEDAAIEPPERENNYPEPSMFGTIPAYGFYVRHGKGLEMRDVEISFMKDEVRPAFVFDDVNGIDLRGLKAQRGVDVPLFVLKNVEDFSLWQSKGVADTRIERVALKRF